VKLYLAGPDVFHPDCAAIAATKKAACAELGAEGLFPLDEKLDLAGLAPAAAAVAIFRANCALLDRADAVLANLTPFRGPSADAGTVWEVGYAFAKGKPLYGYSNVAAPFADRIRAHLAAAPDGLDVEDFGLASDNLMIGCALAGYFAEDVPAADRWTDLGSFRAALKAALGQRP
jgi:nucleoside 2-deoxyribosyltransferase